MNPTDIPTVTVLHRSSYPLCFLMVGFCVLLSWALYRHSVFASGAFDLGIFDQAVWLISLGEAPFSTLLGRHILGDHAALILYPVSLLYRAFPSVITLIVLNVSGIIFGGYLLLRLAREMGMDKKAEAPLMVAYLLHPSVYGNALFDFHTECVALPLIFGFLLSSIRKRYLVSCVLLLLLLTCKEMMGVAAVALGAVLFVLKVPAVAGIVTMAAGVIWFYVSTRYVIPSFSPDGVSAGIERYAQFGKTPSEIILTCLSTTVCVAAVEWWRLLKYVFYLALPFLIFMRRASLIFIGTALPLILVNMLSNLPEQRSTVFQYALPTVPFFVLAAVIGAKQYVLRTRLMLAGVVLVFCLSAVPKFLKRPGEYPHRFVNSEPIVNAYRKALTQISPRMSVAVPAELVPHVSHRAMVHMVTDQSQNLSAYDAVVLSVEQPGWASTQEAMHRFDDLLSRNANFTQVFKMSGVSLFLKKGRSPLQ